MATYSTAARNAMLSALITQIDTGASPAQLRIYSTGGSATGVLLAELNLSNPSFGAPATGVSTAAAISPDTSANASGTASTAEIFSRGNLQVISAITVGTSATELVFNSVAFVLGDNISVTSFTITQLAN